MNCSKMNLAKMCLIFLADNALKFFFAHLSLRRRLVVNIFSAGPTIVAGPQKLETSLRKMT